MGATLGKRYVLGARDVWTVCVGERRSISGTRIAQICLVWQKKSGF